MSGFLRRISVVLLVIAACFAGVRIYAAGSSFSSYYYTLNDDGAKTAAVPHTFAIGSVTQLSSLPYKPGYGYAGHYTGQNCGGTQIIDYQGNVLMSLNASTTLYACWVPYNPPSVVLDDAGGSGGKLSNSGCSRVYRLVHGEYVEFASHFDWAINDYNSKHWLIGCSGTDVITSMYQLPTRSGYTFKGYYTGQNGTGTQIVYQNGTLVDSLSVYNALSASAPTTVYAYWQVDNSGNYKITLNDAGGSGGQVASSAFFSLYEMYGECYASASSQNSNGTLNNGMCISSIYQTPTKTGYDFGGYYTGQNGSGIPIINASGTIVGSNTYFTTAATIYAKWTPKILTITLNHGSPTNSPSPSTVYLKYGVGWYSNSAATTPIYSMTTKPIKTNYTFGGYWTGQNGTGTRVIDTDGDFIYTTAALTAVSTGATVYAYWTSSAAQPTWVTVTLNDKNGNTNPTNYSVPRVIYKNTNTAVANCSGWRSSQSCNASAVITRITVPSLDGYVYGGHYTGTSGGGTPVIDTNGNISSSYAPVSNVTINAKWTSDSGTIRTITLSPNGGTGSNTIYEKYNVGWFRKEGTSYYQITSSIFNGTSSGGAGLSRPTRTNYTFNGYWDAQSGGSQIIDADGYIIGTPSYNTNKTFYAQWVASSTSTVRLEPNGGTACSVTQVTATNGLPMPTLSCAPTRENYVFTGYFDSANEESSGTGLGTQVTQYYNDDLSSAHNWDKTGDQRLYAHWEAVPTYSIKYYCDKSELETGAHYTETGLTYGQSYVVKTRAQVGCDPIAGTKFLGWTYGSSENLWQPGQIVQYPYNSDMDLAAYNMPIGTVTLNHNSPSNTPSPSTVYLVPGDAWYSDSAATTEISSMTTIPVKYGYRFNGYYDAASGGTRIIDANGDFVNVPTSSLSTLYARYTAKKYVLTLDDVDATTASSPSRVLYNVEDGWTNTSGTTITSITKPTKTGNSFGGFWTGPNGTGNMIIDANGAFVTMTTGILMDFDDNSVETLYAKWKPQSTVTFSCENQAGNGSGTPSPATVYIADGETLTFPAFTNCSWGNAGYDPYRWGVVSGGGFTDTHDAGDTITWDSSWGDRTYNVWYAPNYFNYEYSCGDGSGTPPADGNTYYHNGGWKTAVNTCTPPANKHFVGWLEPVSNLTYPEDTGPDIPGGGHGWRWPYDVTDEAGGAFVAQYADDTYTATFTCENNTLSPYVYSGTAPADITDIAYNSTVNLPSPNVCTNNYPDAGWIVSPATAWEYDCFYDGIYHGGSVESNQLSSFVWPYKANCSFKPLAVARSYQLHYSCGTGNGNPPADEEINYTNRNTVRPAANTCTAPVGNHFVGWYDGTNTLQPGQYGGSNALWPYTTTVGLTPKWEADTYNLTWGCGDGTGTPSGAAFPTTINYGDTLTFPANTVCTAPTGYQFTSWVIDINATEYAPNDTFTWNLTDGSAITAHYEPVKVNITYSCGTGATGTVPAAQNNINYGSSVVLQALGNCAKAGHTADKWVVSNTSPTVSYDFGATVNPWNYTENKILTPNWSAQSYSIEYELFGGTQASSGVPASYTYGVGATINGVPTMVGAEFAGWCDTENLTNCAMTKTISATATGTKKFWAKWTCATGYEANDIWLTAPMTVTDYSATGHTTYPAGAACIPGRYHITCDGNGGVACLEQVTSGNANNPQLHLGQFYGVRILYSDGSSAVSGLSTVSATTQTNIESLINNNGGWYVFTKNPAYSTPIDVTSAYTASTYQGFIDAYANAYNSSARFGRAHYTFNGLWSDTEGGTQYIAPNADFGTLITSEAFSKSWLSDTTVYAHWIPDVYTILLDAEGHDGTLPAVYETYNTGWSQTSAGTPGAWVQLTAAQMASKPGYTLLGYYSTASGNGTKYINGDGTLVSGVTPTTFGESTTLHARFQANTYNVTYLCGTGATGTAPAATTATYDADFTPASVGGCTNPGRSFVNWLVVGFNLYDSTATTTNKYYNDSLVYGNGSNTKLSDYMPVVAGQTYTWKSTMTQSGGNIRINWFDKDKNILSQDKQASKTQITVTAPANAVYARFSYPTAYYGTEHVFARASSVSALTAYEASDTRSANTSFAWQYTGGNKTFIAQWTDNTYTITFHPGDGVTTTGTTEVQEWYSHAYRIQSGTGSMSWMATTEITLPTKSGYTFAGYYDNPSFTGNPVMTDASLPVTTPAATYFTADADLYAKWTKTGYTVTYKNGGGTGNDVVQDVAYDTQFTTKPGSIFTKTNYVVTKWNTTSGGTYPNLNSGYTYSTAGNTVLTANWEICQCTPGSHVASCNVTGVTDNTCQYSYTCETGYNNGGATSDTFSGVIDMATNTSPNCGGANSYTITVTAGNGISKVAASGWTNSGTATMTKTFDFGDPIDLSTVVTATQKSGYTGAAYTITSGAGSLSGNVYTVGAGDGTITVSATGIAAPAGVTITGGKTKVYNLSATTLTGKTTTTYDSGITVKYSFGYASSSNGTYGNWTTASTTKTTSIAKDAFLGTRYYKVRVTASDGTLTSTTTTAATPTTMTLNQKTITFDATTNAGALSGTSPLYVRYDSANVYTGATSSTTGTVPTATKTGYTFNGWYTDATNGSQIYNASGTLTSATVSGYTGSSKWRATEDKTLYAQFSAKTDTPYKVYHYTKNLTGTGYTLNGAVDNLTGTSDASVTLESLARTIDGFTYDAGFEGTTTNGTTKPASGAVTTTTILPNGTRVIDLYYNRNSYTITYKNGGGVGADVTQSGISYMGSFTTKPGTTFTKTNSIMTGWDTTSGGNYPLLDHTYSEYDTAGDTVLTAAWATCGCTPGTGVATCTTSATATNTCAATVTCSSGYDQSTATWSCSGATCSSSCSADDYEITLDNANATTNGTAKIYTTHAANVYLDAERTKIMTTGANPITTPKRIYTVTYNGNNGTVGTITAANTTATYTFKGYYSAATNGTQYIVGSTGRITSNGITAGKGYSANATWYAQWTSASVTLPTATRVGHTFAGWYDSATGGNLIGVAGATYTPTENKTLYAHWDECTAGNYCDGTGTVTSCSTATNGKYPHSEAGSTSINDCYLTTTAGKYVASAGDGEVQCTANNYCTGGVVVHYDETGGITACSTGAGSNYTTSAAGSDSNTDCYKTVTLDKNGGSGTIQGTSGTNPASITCHYNTECNFGNASGLVQTGYTFSGGWGTTSTCSGTTVKFTVPNDTGTYYACKSGVGKTCNPGYYLKASNATCTACPAGKYCVGGTFTFNGTDQGITGNIAAGYYATGCAKTSAGAVCSTSYSGGIVSGGYYSTGGGTSATPTAAGNGCLSGNTCGKLSAAYYSNGGGKANDGTCVSGQTCGTCDTNYRANTATGKTAVTQCQTQCAAGRQVAVANAACSTPSGSWYTAQHLVNYGSKSSDTSGVVKSCATNYATANTTTQTDHDAQNDCKRTITLDKNGGTGTVDASVVCSEGAACALPDASGLNQTGYTFAGTWSTTSGVGATNCVSSVNTPTSGTYYACKSANTITIKLNKNGGTGTCGGATGVSEGTVSCTYDGACTAPAWNSTTCNINNGSKIFTGWNTASDGSGTSYAPGASIQNIIGSGETTIYAVWSTVTCNVTNGSGSASNTTTNTPICAVTCTNGYSKTGYMDTTTAFNVTGNAGATTVTSSCVPRTYKVTLDPKRYASASAQTGVEPDSTGTVAYWYRYKTKSPCYYYKVELNSASDEVAANCIAGTNGVTITPPTMAGYTFGGYYKTKPGTGTQYVTGSGGTTGNIYLNVAANSTLYAKWTAKTYTVTLNKNATDAVAGTASVTATYNAAMPTSGVTMPTREGYGFAGYYDTDATTGGKQYYTSAGASANNWDKTANTTLYARWTANCNEITVDNTTRGGSTANTKLYKKSGDTKWYSDSSCETAVTTTPRPTKTHATFAGYYTSATNTTTQVGTNASPSVLSTSWTVTGPATIYAHYNCNTGWQEDGTDIAGTCIGTISATASNKVLTYNGTNGNNGTAQSCANVTVTTPTSGASVTYATKSGTTCGTYGNAPTLTNVNDGPKTICYKVTATNYATVTGEYTCSMNKADGNVVLSATSGTTVYPNTKTFTVTTNKSGGALSVSPTSGSTNVAIASVSGTTVTATPQKTGTQTITVTSAATDNYNAATATYGLTVTDGGITHDVNDVSKTYDGTALVCNGVTNVAPSGATVKYRTATSGAYNLSSAPSITNVSDSKTIYYQITADNYAPVTGQFNCTVTKANCGVTLSKTSDTTTYNTAKTFTASTASGCSLSVSPTSGNTNVAIASITNGTVTVTPQKTGSQTVTVSAAADDNHNASSATYKLTVNAADFTVTKPTTHLTYNGTATDNGTAQTCPAVTVSGLVGGQTATIKYGTASGTYNSSTPRSITNAGDVTVYYQVTATNHNTQTGEYTCTMDARTSVASASDKALTYTGSAQSCANVTLTYPTNGTIKWKTSASASYGTTEPTMTNVSESPKTIYYQVSGTNFTTIEGQYQCTMAKADCTVSLNPTSGTTVYPNNKTFTASTTSGGTLSVSPTSGSTNVAIASISNGTVTATPQKTGTQTITVTSAATDNYNACSAEYTLTVTDGGITHDVSDVSKTYDGTALVCNGVTNVAPSGATVKYRTATSGAYNLSSAPSITNVADSKTIYYQITADNYAPVTGSFTCTVTKANCPITVKEGNTTLTSSSVVTLTYPTSKTLTATSSCGNDVTLSSGNTAYITVSDKTLNPVKVTSSNITMTASVAASANYNAASATFKAKVNRGTCAITLNPTNGSGTCAANTVTFTIDKGACNGTVSAVSSDTDVATVVLNSNKTQGTVTRVSAGNATITVSAPQTDQYEAASAEYAFSGNKVAGSTTIKDGTTTVSSGSVTYPNTKTLSVTCAGGATPSITNSGTTTVATATLSNGTITMTPKSTGSSTITVSCPATDCYNASTATYKLTVNAADFTVTKPTTHLTYNGTATNNGTAQTCPAVTVSGLVGGQTATIKYGTASGTYNSSAPRSITNAGTTTVYYQVTATNHNTQTGEYTCTMDARTSVASASDKALTYTGSAQSCANVTLTYPTNGTIKWKTSASASYGTTVPTMTNVSESPKTIYYQVSGTNFTTIEGQYQCTMTKATGAVTVSATSMELPYSGTGTFTATCNSGSAPTITTNGNTTGTWASGTVTVSASSTYEVAKLTVNCAATTNYTAASKDVTVTVDLGTIALNDAQNGGANGSGTIYTKYNTAVYRNSGRTETMSINAYPVTIPTKTKAVFTGYYDTANGTKQYIAHTGYITSGINGGINAGKALNQNGTWYAKFEDCTCDTSDAGVNTCVASNVTNNQCVYNVTFNPGYTGAAVQTNPNAGVGAYTAVSGAGVYTITLRNYDDTATHSTIYEKYGDGWYSNAAATNSITAATLPTRSGYKFRGFYTAKQADLTQSGGAGTRRITNASTNNLPVATTFAADTPLYAAWATECTAPSHGTCNLVINSDGTATYSASCEAGYTASGATTATPTCTANVYDIDYVFNGGSVVPAEYTPVEYIQGNGSSYIDLGFKASSSMRIESEFKRTSTANSSVFGVYGYGGNLAFYTNTPTTNSYFYGASKIDLGIKLNSTDWHTVVVDGLAKKISVDGSDKAYNPSQFTTTSNMILFGRRHSSNGYGMYMTGQIKYFNVYDNGTLIHNYVPVRSGTVCGMYDTVEQTFVTGNTQSAFSCPSVASLPDQYTYGVGADITGVPVRAHSTFVGWCENSGLTNNCVTPQNVSTTAMGDKTFYAKWTCNTGYTANAAGTACVANTYTVSFNSNGATGTSGSQTANVTATYGMAMPTISTTKPTKTGHTFMGWYDNATYTSGTQYYTAAGASARAYDKTSGTTLYAGWNPNVYTITLNDNNGAGGNGAVYEKYNNGWSLTNFGTTITKLTQAPTRDGYTFRGYYTGTPADVTASGNTGTQRVKKDLTLPANTTFTANTTLRAGWAKNCTVPAHGTCELSVTNDGAVTYTTTCEDGYTLGGNETATPTCTANTITLNFVSEHGTAPAATTCTYGSTFNMPAAITGVVGYTFHRWNVNDTDFGANETGVACDNATLGVTSGAVTINATWKYNHYLITLDDNGGNGGQVAQDATWGMFERYSQCYIAAQVLNTVDLEASRCLEYIYAAPTKQGYTFAGYYTENNELVINANKKVVAEPTLFEQNSTIYAHWTADSDIQYKVYHYTKNLGTNTYSLNGTVDTLYGVADSTVTLANLKRTIAGFTYDSGFETTTTNGTHGTTKPASGAVTTTTILADGTRVIDLYYNRDTHTVTLTKGTGIASVSGAGTYEYGASVSIDATMSNGYDWYRWTNTSTGAAVTTTKAYTFTMGTANIAYTANAKVHSYTITYDLNPGTGSTTPAHGTNHPGTYKVTDATFTISNPSMAGYTFAGWTVTTAPTWANGSSTSGSTDFVVASGTYGNIAFRATWTANTYSIAYTLNGGAYGASHPVGATFDAQFTVNNPTHEHATFTGWNISGMDTTTHTYGSQTTNATTLSGVTATTFKNLRSTSGTVTFTATWNCDTGYTGTNCDAIDYNMQYVCEAEPGWNYRGSAPVATNPVHYGQSVQLAGDVYTELDGCRKVWGTTNDADYCDDCFTFGGWTIDAEGTALGQTRTRDANSTVNPWGRTNTTDWCIISDTGNCEGFADDIFYVRPQYTPKQYNIEYMYATGPVSGASANMPVNYTYTMGDTISNADQTAPAHATFNGWCTGANGTGTCYAAGQPITIGNRDHGDMRYYANWSCDAGYTLTYDANNQPVCSADTITCAAGFYLPANSTTCEPCLKNYYCTGGTWTYDGTAKGLTQCPVPADHKRTTFPSHYYTFVAWNSTGYANSAPTASGGYRAITQCQALNWLEFNRGKLYEYVRYNETSGKYDNNTGAWGWSDVKPGYYLTTKSACGAYAYYHDALECVAGGYCPGKTRVVCNSSNSATVHTATFGLELCADNTYSNVGATECTACLTANGYENSGDEFADHAYESSCKTTCAVGQCVATARAACANVGTTGWATGGVVPQGDTLTCNVCPNGTSTCGYGTCADEAGDCGRVLHVGANQLYLRSNRKTDRTLNVKIGNNVYYANMSPVNLNMSDGANKSFKIKIGNTVYSVHDDSVGE